NHTRSMPGNGSHRDSGLASNASPRHRSPIGPGQTAARPAGRLVGASGAPTCARSHRPEGELRHMGKIIYTHTDEAPLLATYSFLPIVQAFASSAGVDL